MIHFTTYAKRRIALALVLLLAFLWAWPTVSKWPTVEETRLEEWRGK